MISHGLAAFLKERFSECSDGYDCYVDDKSGIIAIGNPDKKIFLGKSTDNYSSITKIKIPYTMKQSNRLQGWCKLTLVNQCIVLRFVENLQILMR